MVILQFEDLPPIPDHLPIVQRGTPLEALWEELGLEKEELTIACSSEKAQSGWSKTFWHGSIGV